MKKWLKGKIKLLFSWLTRKRKSIIKWSSILIVIYLCCYIFGYVLNCFIEGGFHFKASLLLLFAGKTFMYSGVFFMLFGFIVLFNYHNHYWLFNSKNIIKGKERDKHISANLEQARFESDEEIERNFDTVYYDELPEKEVKGIPILAYEEGKRLKITASPSTHA